MNLEDQNKLMAAQLRNLVVELRAAASVFDEMKLTVSSFLLTQQAKKTELILKQIANDNTK